MPKKLIIGILGMLLIGLTGCKVRTPEIKGVVLDEQTKEPVANAWIHARIGLTTKTLAGDVWSFWAVDPPHTRTDGKGEFLIPAKEFETPSIPYGFGTKVSQFCIVAETIDDRIGGGNLIGSESKDTIRVVVSTRALEGITKEDRKNPELAFLSYGFRFWSEFREGKDEEAYHSYIRSLYRYCMEGRFSSEIPAVEDGCDEWELDYAIVKHERFLKKLGVPKTIDQETYYAATLRQLGYLYKREKDYKKSLEAFKEVLDFDKKRNMDLRFREYEREIRDIEKILREK